MKKVFEKQKGVVLIGLSLIMTTLAVTSISVNPTLVFANGTTNVPTKATIINNPTKTNYLAGEVFDPSGLSLNISCSAGTNFVLDYDSEVDKTKFTYDTTPLTNETTSISVSYNSPNGGTVNVSIPVFVDNYRIDQAEMYINSEERVMFSIGGAYGEGYEDSIREARFYLVPLKDRYIFDEVNPVVTPASFGATYGSFSAEIDITNIQSSGDSNKNATKAKYWPHFVMDGVDRDLKFPNLETKTLSSPSEEGLTYKLDLYISANEDKYIPTVCAYGDDAKLTYYYDANDTTEDLPAEITHGYRPLYADISLVDNKVLYTVTAKYRGYETIREIERALAFGVLGYITGASAATIGTKEINAPSLDFSNLYLEMDEENSTFSYSYDVTNFETNYVKSSTYYSYFFRLGGNAGSTNDTKVAHTTNNGKTVTFDGRDFIVLCDKSNGDKSNAWGGLGLRIKPTTSA